LVAALLAYPDVKSEWKNPVAMSFMPVVPIGFMKDGQVLNYFLMVTTVGTSQTVAAQELRIECMFPAERRPRSTIPR
jgi:tellurite resistance protein TehA-like permease